MNIKRPMLFLTAVFVLGELVGMPEGVFYARAAASAAFVFLLCYHELARLRRIGEGKARGEERKRPEQLGTNLKGGKIYIFLLFIFCMGIFISHKKTADFKHDENVVSEMSGEEKPLIKGEISKVELKEKYRLIELKNVTVTKEAGGENAARGEKEAFAEAGNKKGRSERKNEKKRKGKSEINSSSDGERKKEIKNVEKTEKLRGKLCVYDYNAAKDKKGGKKKERDKEQELYPGMKLSFRAFPELFDEPRNPGEFDYSLYQKSLNISASASLSSYEITDYTKSPYLSVIQELKERCGEVLESIMSERDSGIYKALLLGEKSDMDENIRELYQSQGIAHLLAVSGLHLSLIGMLFYNAALKAGAGLGTAGTVSAFFVISYGIFTGASGSALRAVIMLITRFLAAKSGRCFDSLSALSLSALLLLLFSPYMLFQSGFQLSFAAILAISLFGDFAISRTEEYLKNSYIDEKLEKCDCLTGFEGILPGGCRDAFTLRKLFFTGEGTGFLGETAGADFANEEGGERKELARLYRTYIKLRREAYRKCRLGSAEKTILMGIFIQIFTLPVILYHFFCFPVYGFFLNLIVIPLMAFVMYSGMAGLASGFVFPGLSPIFIGAGHYILNFYELLCKITSSLPANSIVAGRPEPALIFIYYALIFLIPYYFTGGDREIKYRCKKLKYKSGKLKRRDIKRRAGKGKGQEFCFFGNKNLNYKMKTAYTTALLIIFCIACSLVFYKKGPSELEITAADVGQGDGFLIRYKGANILIDMGSSSENKLGKYTAEPLLQSAGIGKIDMAIVSHGDEDHISGVRYLLEEAENIHIENLVLPKAAKMQEDRFENSVGGYSQNSAEEISEKASENSDEGYSENSDDGYSGKAYKNSSDNSYETLILLAKKRGTRVSYLERGDSVKLSEDISIDCIYEGNAQSDEMNAHSAFLMLKYKDFSMLFTGDAPKEEEMRLIKTIVEAGDYRASANAEKGRETGMKVKLTVLKAGHHGSKTSTCEKLLAVFEPAYAILSYGEDNSYGHPHSEVMERLKAHKTELLETAKCGAIKLVTDGKRLRTEKFLEE